MSNFREKGQVFIIGLTIGLLIAGAFFILKLDDYFKELSFYKSAANQTISVEENKTNSNDNFDNLKKNTSKSHKIKTVSSSILQNSNNAEFASVPDTSKNHPLKDSISELFVASNDIIVRKDELLSTKTIEVYNLNPLAKLSPRDSMLQKVSNIKDDRSFGKQMFNIEFWQSPLNYKGYKISKYKMILYGISSSDELKIYKLDDFVYLKIASVVYRLDYANDFKQYERVSDDTILNKLK